MRRKTLNTVRVQSRHLQLIALCPLCSGVNTRSEPIREEGFPGIFSLILSTKVSEKYKMLESKMNGTILASECASGPFAS